MTLNPEQKRIAGEPIDATIKTLAGAGTGKTRVLVERYLKFLFDDGIGNHLNCPVSNILGIVYTVGSEEMFMLYFSKNRS